MEERKEKRVYKVVVDKQGMYSIWPADRENLAGWTDVGKQGAQGTQDECLAYIKEVWTDMRPLT